MTLSLDNTTAELLEAHRARTGEQRPFVLSAALANEDVLTELRRQWPRVADIPGMASQRRRLPGGTRPMQLRMNAAGKAYLAHLAEETNAPSISAFVSAALNIYLRRLGAEA